MKIALVTAETLEKFAQGVSNNEDTELVTFLRRKGLDVHLQVWSDPELVWKDYHAVIIKSPWDYHERLTEFLAWLDRLEDMGIQIFNSASLIRWNSNKVYLKEFQDQGLPVIPSAFLPRGSVFDPGIFGLFDTNKLVVKPCVSAGAQNTFVVDQSTFPEQAEHFRTLFAQQDYMAQPYVDEIQNGEWSFLFFNGTFSHSVLKTPKAGDFRVQHYLGGFISSPPPEQAHIDAAALFVESLPGTTLYARVDGVIIDHRFVLMEIELIEPYLYFRGSEQLMENYFDALMELLKST